MDTYNPNKIKFTWTFKFSRADYEKRTDSILVNKMMSNGAYKRRRMNSYAV